MDLWGAGVNTGIFQEQDPGEVVIPCGEWLTMVLANVTPEGRYQGGGVVEDAIDIRRPSVDRSTEQVDISSLAVNSLIITKDSEERLSHH